MMRVLLSPQTARKAYDRLSTKVRGLPQWLRDRGQSTYLTMDRVPAGQIRGHLLNLELDPKERVRILHLADQFIQHRFDILGSGWRDWNDARSSHDRSGPSPANSARSLELRAHLPQAYRPIDWHIDIKSGARFESRRWFQNIPRAQIDVDAKVPWEMARCHHFQILARAFAYTGLSGFEREMQSQFYDFSAANPPRFGVNWASPMDVGIRAVNWLVAFDIARALGAEFTPAFDRDFKISVFEHGQHLFDHLESSPSDRANHYLSNLCALIAIAAYLPDDPQGWMDFAVREWTVEVQRQFLVDGGSFEGSTCYHRLSAEMCFYAAFLQTACGRQVDPLVLERLRAAALFTAGILKPNGRVPQIGDNDSGRFLNLGWEEDSLDHRHLVNIANVAFGTSEPTDFETHVARGFLKGRHYQAGAQTQNAIPPPSTLPDFEAIFAAAEFKRDCTIPFPKVIKGPISLQAWPDFGLYVFKASDFYLSARCDRRDHLSMEGHCHNDIFGLDLRIAGQDLLRDPGSFIYAPQPTTRNLYRSFGAHFPSNWLQGLATETLTALLFTFPDRLAGEVLSVTTRQFIARAQCRRGWFYLAIDIGEGELKIRAVAPEKINAPFWPEIKFSSGYGCLSDEPAFIVASAPLL